MAISHDTELMDGLKEALNKAVKNQKKVLFSEIIKIDDVCPLSFYQAGREHYLGERFFWQDPNQEVILSGLGKAEKIQAPADSSRYEYIKQEWNELVSESVRRGVSQVAGTGPLIFGGFSFDHHKSNSELWDQFGDNLFYIPRFMLSKVKGQAYLTTNFICSPGDEIQAFIKMVNERDTYINSKFVPAYSNPLLIEQAEIKPAEWIESVSGAIDHIKQSDVDKLVLAREMRLKFEAQLQSEMVLDRLMKEQEKSFIFSLEVGSEFFVGASPERLIKKTANVLFSACLAGSIARGKNEQEDDALGEALLHDEKNLKEHQYVVSMIQDAMINTCEVVEVPRSPILLKNRHIQHLYTPVEGRAKQDVSIFDILYKLHPTPALGGLPQEKALIWIRENEDLERGFYAAPLGWIDAGGNGEFAVAIRSGLVQGNEASLFAGCGIVADSKPESEYQETSIKFKPMLSALGGKLDD
ncbi:isochorismate synthase MenF [Peribacillus sp. SCS-155]|uniref:isochorismate synthase n=1 Tax=Peribacillus sedimenti TaxID=3115297 RepID=UPI0039067FD1